jgi:hypothetical protein
MTFRHFAPPSVSLFDCHNVAILTKPTVHDPFVDRQRRRKSIACWTEFCSLHRVFRAEPFERLNKVTFTQGASPGRASLPIYLSRPGPVSALRNATTAATALGARPRVPSCGGLPG